MCQRVGGAIPPCVEVLILQKLDTGLPGVWELRPKVFRDARGFFLETYQQASFAALGISDAFVQDNQSLSGRGSLRGLHYQLHRPQAKLCRVIEGEVLDVCVDIRWGSPTFGKWTSVLLSARDHNQIYIPRGFAHGFLALTEVVQFLYKCSDFYDVADNYGILWNDPEIAIAWGTDNPLLSEKDRQHPTLETVPREHLPRYERP
jgi:dTDP-4-dehydrorhamnose 3,5-epimerase